MISNKASENIIYRISDDNLNNDSYEYKEKKSKNTIPKNIENTSPYLFIKFKDCDHRVLDNAVKNICNILNEHNITYIGPLLLPVKKKNSNLIYSRSIKIQKDLFNYVTNNMQTLNLPSSLELELKIHS